jgi:hypothetical protein
VIGQTLPAILIVLVLALWPIALPPERRARIWLRQGLIWFGVVGGFIMLFIIGETFTDPGGLQAVAMVSMWVIPAGLLSWLALARPAEAAITLTAVCALSTAFNIWAVAVGEWWWRFENQHGPISAIITFASTIPLGFMAWRQPWWAGWLLVGTTLLPDLTVMVRNPDRGAISLGFLTSPGIVAGVLFVLAGYANRHKPGGLTSIRGITPPHDYPDVPGTTDKAA